MPFQPFGYHFEVRSALPPDAVKAAVRARKKSWFDPKSGARGWIAGPFICLWASAFDRYGPMVFGRILRDGSETRIVGRAGSDLNGIALFALLVPMLAFGLWKMVEGGDYTLWQIAVIGGLVLFSPLMFWWSSQDRHKADPLVRFLRTAAEKPGKAPKPKPVVLPAASSFLKSLTLEESGSVMDGPVTPAMVRESLEAIDRDGFVILSSAEEHYVQTVPECDGYIVEKRDGDDDHHYRAARHGSPHEKDIFTFEETLTIFLAYGAGARMPAFLEWKKIRV